MGYLAYDNRTIEFDDRVLAHIQIVIVQKLRRREGFLMSWRDGNEIGDGRSSIWLSSEIPLFFKFSGGQPPQLNMAWIAALTLSANSSRGLIVSGENDAAQPKVVTRHSD
jgi:hypothetical protein